MPKNIIEHHSIIFRSNPKRGREAPFDFKGRVDRGGGGRGKGGGGRG